MILEGNVLLRDKVEVNLVILSGLSYHLNNEETENQRERDLVRIISIFHSSPRLLVGRPAKTIYPHRFSTTHPTALAADVTRMSPSKISLSRRQTTRRGHCFFRLRNILPFTWLPHMNWSLPNYHNYDKINEGELGHTYSKCNRWEVHAKC